MKKIVSIILTLTIFSVVIFANTDVIQFTKGKFSATVVGRIGGKAERNFTFNAKEGQRVIIKITSPNRKVGVEGFGSTNEDGYVNTEIDGTAEAGENSFTVVNTGSRATNFNVTVTVK